MALSEVVGTLGYTGFILRPLIMANLTDKACYEKERRS